MEIEFKNKKYLIKDKIKFKYVESYRTVVQRYNNNEITISPEREYIRICKEAICPTLDIDLGELTYDEIEDLVAKCTDAIRYATEHNSIYAKKTGNAKKDKEAKND